MSDLPIPRAPRDLNAPRRDLNIARHSISIEEQQLVIDEKHLRLLEIGEEETRILADLTENLRPEAARREEAAKVIEKKQGPSTADSLRARIKVRQQSIVIQQREFRLLELDDERQGVEFDLDVSGTALARLQAEVSQQRALLSEEPHG